MTTILEGHESPVYAVEFNETGTLLASGGLDERLVIWDLESLVEDSEEQQEVLMFDKKMGASVTGLQWSNLSEELMFSCHSDSKCFAFDLTKGKKVKTFQHPKNNCINQIAASKRDFIITCCDDGGVRAFDLRSRDPINTIENPYPILTTVIDANEQFAYFSGVDPSVCCFDVRKNEIIWKESSQSSNVVSLSLSSNSEYLVSSSIDGTIKYFDARSHLEHVKIRSKPYVFEGAKFSDEDWSIRNKIVDSNSNTNNQSFTVFSGSNDGLLFSWDLASRKTINKLNFNVGTIFDIDYNKQKNLLVSGSLSGSLVLSYL